RFPITRTIRNRRFSESRFVVWQNNPTAQPQLSRDFKRQDVGATSCRTDQRRSFRIDERLTNPLLNPNAILCRKTFHNRIRGVYTPTCKCDDHKSLPSFSSENVP